MRLQLREDPRGRSDPDMRRRRSRDTLIYEYVGDVVSNPTFMKRMREYAEEGIEHFYFMMLQKDEVSGIASPARPRQLCAITALAARFAVHRRNEARRDRPFRESLLQPELLCRKVDHRAARPDGHFLESRDQEGRGTDVQLQRRSLWVRCARPPSAGPLVGELT